MKLPATLFFGAGAALAGWWAGGMGQPPPSVPGWVDAAMIVEEEARAAHQPTASERFQAFALGLQSPPRTSDFKKHEAVLPLLADLIKAQWQRADPAACLAWQVGQGIPPGGGESLALLKELANTDPEAAIKTALGMGTQGWYAAGQICLHCALTDPEKAQALWDALPPAAKERNHLELTMATVTAKTAADLTALLTGKDWGSKIHQLDGACAAIWPEKAALLKEAATKLPPGQVRTRMMAGVLKEMAKTDPEAALQWCETHEPTDAARAVVALHMAEQQPVKAWELAQTLSGREVAGVRGAAAKALSLTDPAAALEIALGAEPDKQRWGNGRSNLLATLMASQPGESAAARAARFETMASQCEERGIEAIELATAARLSLDETGLASWLDRQGNAKAEITAVLAGQIEEESPRQAVAWASETLTHASDNKDALASLGKAFANWAGDEPESAAAAALALPEGKAREAAVANTGVNWYFADAPAATAWLTAQPPGTGRDNAVLSLADEMGARDPAAAAHLIATLSTDEALTQFSKTKTLTPALKAALRSTLPGNSAWSAAQRDALSLNP